MKFKDYYRIMGLAPDASADELKTAYRKLARQLHPDVNKAADAEARFKDLSEANEVLKDPEKRAAYDRLRAGGWREGQEIDAPPPGFHQSRRQAGGGSSDDGGGFAGGAFAGDDASGMDFSDLFQSLFRGTGRGGAARGARRERGEDIHHVMRVSLEEAYHGAERVLHLRVPEVDERGRMSLRTRTITAKIPAGVAQGTLIRLRGQGEPGGAPDQAGDLYLEVELIAHPRLRVDGRDLTAEVAIAPWEAALGARIAVPTLGGPVTATIPAGAQSGQKLRLRGRGLPGEPPGDHYLELRIVVPAAPSERAKTLYRELADESAGFDPRAEREK